MTRPHSHITEVIEYLEDTKAPDEVTNAALDVQRYLDRCHQARLLLNPRSDKIADGLDV
mgnify:CR=1 FL=1